MSWNWSDIADQLINAEVFCVDQGYSSEHNYPISFPVREY